VAKTTESSENLVLLFVGPVWEGSTALHRMRAFASLTGVNVVPLDSAERVGKATLVDRIRHRLSWPADRTHLNERLLELVTQHRPDMVFIDSTRLFTRPAILAVRETGCLAAYYSPDDVSQKHNSSRQLESCDKEWDCFFTTKSFNVSELRERGVRNPQLIGNAFDPQEHRPMTPAEVGSDFEGFDVVFVGTYEAERARSIGYLAENSVRVVVYGSGWRSDQLPSSVTLRPAVFATEYSRCLHTGKLALCFLRKLNRDRITQRSIEIPGAGRTMVAEKTDEHDQHFVDGTEYIGFRDDCELLARCRELLADDTRRLAIARAGRQRCLQSHYSTCDRAREMLQMMRAAIPTASVAGF
jgi:spore maturation protein CgeB